MKIGIDARMLGPRQGGLGRYVEQLVRNLEHTVATDEVVVFMRRDNWDAYTPHSPRFKKVLIDIPWYGWREQVELPKSIQAEKVDLMHFPHWNVPITYNKPFIVTIHDLLLLHYPTRAASTLGPVTYWIKNLAFHITIKHAIKASRAIITPSNYTKLDIHKTYMTPLEKMVVTYQGATPLQNNQTVNTLVLEKNHITKPYILYVGVSYPHKNLDQLLKAWQRFETSYGTDFQLVLAGKRNFFYERLLASKTWQSCREVIFTDYVSDEELATLYKHAQLYVMPSLYEGAGLPPLEALAHNVPVVSSSATCLPEILQESALYFDPTSTTDIAQTIHRGLTDTVFRSKSLAEGAVLLTKYSAQEMAKATLDLYHTHGG